MYSRTFTRAWSILMSPSGCSRRNVSSASRTAAALSASSLSWTRPTNAPSHALRNPRAFVTFPSSRQRRKYVSYSSVASRSASRTEPSSPRQAELLVCSEIRQLAQQVVERLEGEKVIKYRTEQERRELKRARDRAYQARRRAAKKASGFLPPRQLGPVASSRRALPPVTEPGTVHVALVLDASGSMFTLRDNAVRALNRQVQNLSRVTRDTGQKTLVSLFLFNDRGNLRTLARRLHPDLVPEVTRRNYNPTGQTALLDAIKDVSAELSAADGGRRTSFLVVVVTDGQENDSLTSRFTIQELIRKNQATDRWTFAISVPRGGRRWAAELGIPSGNIQEWETTELGLERMSQNVIASSTSYYAGQAKGVTASRSFFTDLSKIDAAALKQLDDLTGDFRHWKVEQEADIRPFVEGRGVPYQIGRAYYQLTKAEKVQHHKDFVVRDKTSRRLYGGDQARTLVGISRNAGVEVRVHPGNHANFDLFIQSTSTNRKLVRGTTLLYRVN